MSNPKKGIIAKISSLIQITAKAFTGKSNPDNETEKTLTYEEYRKTVQLSDRAYTVRVKKAPEAPKKVTPAVPANKRIDEVLYSLTNGKYGVLDTEGEEEAGNLVLA